MNILPEAIVGERQKVSLFGASWPCFGTKKTIITR